MKKLIDSLRSGIQTITHWLALGCPLRAIFGRGLASTLLFFSAALLAQPCGASPFQWAVTGSLNISRDDHTATLLPDGEVLVAGGFGASAVQATVELYDPATGSWSFTGSLNKGRVSHTATLLPDGMVLVAAGTDIGIGDVATAELYDPATGAWTLTGSLNFGRYYHTATLLADGKVLVAGGYSYPEDLASAELYDPAAGTWSVTGSLDTARQQFTATLLPDGRVLVAGGYNTSKGALAGAELYDPATGTWIVTGSLNTARYRHTATLLLDGKILVAGGVQVDGGDALARTELYDPATGTWTVTDNLQAARQSHTATLLASGTVLVAGGDNGHFLANGRLASAELYDPATGKWTATGKLATGRYHYTATLLPNGQVLAAAGYGNPVGQISSAELYDPGIVVAATVDGRGAIDVDRDEITFNFHAAQGDDGSTLGSFSFCDPAAGNCLTNAKFYSLSVDGNTAYFVGSARLDEGRKVIFNVSATDNGSPGTADSISVMLYDAYSVAGPLISGDIRIK
jgi:Galactose oxidase, central domain/Kelch motif